MKCPICNSSDLNELEKRHKSDRRIERDYECLNCFTSYTTKETIITSSMPEFVREMAHVKIGDIYLSKTEVEQAEQRGISKQLIRQRMRNGLSKEEALTKEPEKKTNWKGYSKLAVSNGIKKGTFYSRVKNQGMDLETAATLPIQPGGRKREA